MGGYEDADVWELLGTRLPVTLVIPQGVRQYVRAKGWLAKTVRLDVEVPAVYGKTQQMRLFMSKSEDRKRLSAWDDGENRNGLTG